MKIFSTLNYVSVKILKRICDGIPIFDVSKRMLDILTLFPLFSVTKCLTMVHIRIQRLVLDKLADFVLSNFDFDFWPKVSAFKTWKIFLVRQSLKET
jgi:hypothetical protein